MNLIKLGKKGQVSIPQGVLRQLGIAPDSPLLVETTDDGAIVLRQVSVHPVEMYSDARIAEFESENALTPAQRRKFAPRIADFSAWLAAQAPTQAAPRAAEARAPYRSAPQPRAAKAGSAKSSAASKFPALRGAKR
jgi:AbrB family looped-hinge helix DNA binding protein